MQTKKAPPTKTVVKQESNDDDSSDESSESDEVPHYRILIPKLPPNKSNVEFIFSQDAEVLTHLLLIKEPAKKPAAKSLVAVTKNGSKKVKEESSSDEGSSDEESSDDEDVSIMFLFLCLIHN